MVGSDTARAPHEQPVVNAASGLRAGSVPASRPAAEASGLTTWLRNPARKASPAPVVLICRTGKRSALAAKMLNDAAPTRKIYNVSDGITGWSRANQPVVSFQQNVQTVAVPAGGGAVFDVKIDQPGLYPLVSHAFAHVDLGQVGLLKVGSVAGTMSH